MRLYEIRETTGIDALTLTERSTPGPGAGQVLVRMKAASINYRDLVVAGGGYGRNVKLPLAPFSDGSGEVVETGPGVTRVKAGDRVAGAFMQRWIIGGYKEEYGRSALGGAIDGVLAEYSVFDQDGVVALPAHLSWEEGATLPCAAVTAWNALFAEGGVGPGDTVLTLGAGGVSTFALQLAKMAGASVIAVSGSDAKLSQLQQLGADRLINYQKDPKWSRAVREQTRGVGVDCVVEVGGAGTLEQSLRAVRAGGVISYIGVAAGQGEFNPNWLFMKAIRLRGIYVGSREMFEALNRAITTASLRPVIDKVFPFEQAREAMRRLESGKHHGKIVVRID